MGVEQKQATSLNKFKWLIILLILTGGIGLNYYFIDVAWGIRSAAALVLLIIILYVFALTSQGQKALSFMGASRVELRKVVWPTRQETTQMAMIVVVMVLIASAILWGFDSIFYTAIGWVSGQRG